MSFSMSDGDNTTTTTSLPYPAGSTVTRLPVFINGFSEPVVAKVKQPQIKPTPISSNLRLIPPEVVAGDEQRMRTLEKKDTARSVWTLRDETNGTQFTGSAEQGDNNNRYYLLFTDLGQNKAHLLGIRQLNLQKTNTVVPFKTLEEVEEFNKQRAKAATKVKPQDLGLPDDLESIKKTILSDKLKKQAKGGKKGDSKPKSGRSSGGYGKDGEFDYDDGEDVWEVADDDEGIANKDLNDFEDTGDWAGEKKSDFVDEDGDEFNDEAKDINDLNSNYFGDNTKNTMEDDSSEDENDTTTFAGPLVTPASVGPKRRGAPVVGEGEDDEEQLNQIKRPKSLLKKK